MSGYDFSAVQDFSSIEGFGTNDEISSGAEAYESAFRLKGGATIAIVEADVEVREYLASQFDGVVDTAATMEQLEPELGLSSRVMILGPSCVTANVFGTVESWQQRYPNVAAILITFELSTQVLHKALRAGIKDVLTAPINIEQLTETINRVAEDLPTADQMVAPAAPHYADPSGPGQAGRIISVFSTKGGSGKSVLAANMAVTLARRSPGRVVLIDGHLQFGDAAVMLKLQPRRTLVDALAKLDTLDDAMFEELCTPHEPSGLMVLPAPLDPAFADQVVGADLVRLIKRVGMWAGHVVVDLPAIFNEVVLSVLEISDDIVFVAGLDIPNIKNVKIGLNTLDLLDIPKERVHLVLNRADSKVKLDVAEVERTLGLSAIARIPSDVVVPISVNKGEPVVLSAPKSAVARAYEQFAIRFIDGAAAEPAQQQRRKFFG